MGRIDRKTLQSLFLPGWGAIKAVAPRSRLLSFVFILGFLTGGIVRPLRWSSPAPEEAALSAGESMPIVQSVSRPPGAPDARVKSRHAADAGRGEGIRFAFYNLRNYLPASRVVKGQTVEEVPKPEAEIAVVVDSIAQVRPDILGVCEIGGMAEVEDLRRRLREHGLDHPHVEWVDAADEERHLALFSAFPFVEKNSQTRLTYVMGDREYPVHRGFLDATVAVNGSYRLRCVGVHLKSRREVAEGDQELMRRNEAHLLRKYLDRVFREEPWVNLLVYGDFNDTRNEVSIRAIQGPPGAPGNLRPIDLVDDQGEAWTHHWALADIYSRIDFLFYSKGLSPEIERSRSFVYARDDWERGSDHRMIVATIMPEERRR